MSSAVAVPQQEDEGHLASRNSAELRPSFAAPLTPTHTDAQRFTLHRADEAGCPVQARVMQFTLSNTGISLTERPSECLDDVTLV